MSKETPCIAVCMMDPRTRLCLGCGRTLPEIARWHRMDTAERRSVMARPAARLADAGLAPPEPAAGPAARVVAGRDPEQLSRTSDSVSDRLRNRPVSPAHAVQIPRRQGGEF